jgi:hypothetical protein
MNDRWISWFGTCAKGINCALCYNLSKNIWNFYSSVQFLFCFLTLLPQLQFIVLKPRYWTFLYIIKIIAIYIYWRDTIISAFWFHFASLDLKNGCNRYQMIALIWTNIWAKCSEIIIEEFTRHITLIYQHIVFYATLISRWWPQNN